MFSNDGKRKPVTITEIAQQAGVTAQTVSYVLSNNPNVKISEGTRRLVNRIAKELGYRPNRLAQAMKSGRMQMIGLWVPLTGRHVRSSVRFLSELHKIYKEGDHDTLLFDVGSDSMTVPPTTGWPIDGIVGFDCLDAFKLAHEAGTLPHTAIFVGRANPYADSVCWNIEQGYRTLTECLLAKGVRHIGLLGNVEKLKSGESERAKGVQTAAGNRNIKISMIDAGNHSQDLATSLQPHLNGSNSLDAVIACCDSSAAAAVNEITKAGLTLGQDIYVGSYGDSANYENFPAGVISLRIPFEEAAQTVWSRMKERLEGKTGAPEHVSLPMSLNIPVESR